MMTADMLPCPFCGGFMEDRGYGAVHIDGKGCPIGDLAIDVEKWNRRAPVSATQNYADPVSSAATVSAGKVKALVWETVLCTNERAHSVGLCYEVAQHASSGEWFWWLQHLPHRKSAPFESVEAAKAAAQADYAARILAALQPGDGWQDRSQSEPPKDAPFLARNPGFAAFLAEWSEMDQDYLTYEDADGWQAIWFSHWMAIPDLPASLPQGEETR